MRLAGASGGLDTEFAFRGPLGRASSISESPKIIVVLLCAYAWGSRASPPLCRQHGAGIGPRATTERNCAPLRAVVALSGKFTLFSTNFHNFKKMRG